MSRDNYQTLLIIVACLFIVGCGSWDKECDHGVVTGIVIQPPSKCLLLLGDAHYVVKLKHIEKDITIGSEVTVCLRTTPWGQYYTVHLITEEGQGADK